MDDLLKGVFVGVLLITLLFSNPAFALVAENAQNSSQSPIQIFFEDTTPIPTLFDSNPVTGNEVTTQNPIENTVDNTTTNTNQNNLTNSNSYDNSSGAGFSCDVVSLTPQEAKQIMNLTHDNFQGETISDGKDTNADGKNLEGLELVGEDNDGKTAVKVAPPTQAGSADRYSFLDKVKALGPWGIGLVLDDTLRVGRCDYGTDEQGNCRINGDGLNYRTSGVGFKSDLTSAVASLKDTTTQNALGVTQQEYEAMQNQVLDANSLELKVVKINASDTIKNSFLTEGYIAKNATNCNNNSCMVSTYSAFDKYFNAWFSTDLVVSSFAPTLLNSAGKKLGLLGRGADNKSAYGKFVSKVNSWFSNARDKTFNELPSALLGQSRKNHFQATIKEAGIGDLFKKLTIDRAAFANGATGYVDDLLKADSALMKATPFQKEKFFEALQDLESYAGASADGMKAAKSTYTSVIASAVTQAQKDQALIDYGRNVAANMKDWDDYIFLDFPQWLQRNSELFGFQGYAVKKVGFSGNTGYVELTTGETFNVTKGIIADYINNGVLTGRGEVPLEFGQEGLKLFKLGNSTFVENVGVSDLEKYLAKVGEGTFSVDIPGSGALPLNQSSINVIKSNPALGGNIKVYKSDWIPADDIPELTTKELATRLTQDRILGRPGTAVKNLNDLDYALRQDPVFVARKSLSGLDALFSNEKSLIKNYYTLKANTTGFYKVVLGPYAFWNAKRAVGNETYSAYMIPDTWTTMNVYQGTDDIFRDSYIDFYANEGSDQGDLFARAINNIAFFPTYLIKTFAETTISPLKGTIEKFTGEGGLGSKPIMRDEVKDIAFYSHNENCSGCTGNFDIENDYLTFVGNLPSSIQAFVVEAADKKTKEDGGTTLIAYTHHSNMKGQTGDIEGEEVNIASAENDGTTCDQKLRELHLGFAGTASGGILAFGESFLYVVNPGFGLLASGAQQILITPELQDCVDDKEGYYIHFYAPPEESQKDSKSKETLSNETVTDALSSMASSVKNLASSTDNPVAESLSKLNTQFTDFAGQAKQANLLQANIELSAPSSGKITGKEVFYVWYKEATLPSGLKLDGVMVTKDGNQEVKIDYDKGDLEINGKTVISNKPDIVGLITPGDNRIPAQVVPVKVNTIGAPQTNETVFELSASGEILVLEEQVLSCIQSAVKAQVGINYSGNELTYVFGDLQGISTEQYGNIFARDNKIYLEGNGPRAQGDMSSRFIVDGYWNTRLVVDSNSVIDGGQFIGMTFANGTIVLNTRTNKLVVWLRQHAQSVLSNKDVSALKAKPTTVIDPETNCEQPAIQLEASAYPNDELGQQKVQNFNDSMNHLGPFTQFTTDGKIYEFYSKLVDGECKDFFRVTDKETGKVLTDSEIVGGIQQDGQGNIMFKTADGKSHTLAFDAENGVPKLSYNGAPAETLRTASCRCCGT